MSARLVVRLARLEARRWPRRVRLVWWDRRQPRPAVAAEAGERVYLVSWQLPEQPAPRSLP